MLLTLELFLINTYNQIFIIQTKWQTLTDFKDFIEVQ